jgi:hypothetical protein
LKLRNQPQEYYPVWENMVLIQAENDYQAFQKATLRGQEEARDEGWTLDGQPAEWIFAGVRKICACDDPEQRPDDGAEVSYNELEMDSEEAVKQFAAGRPVTVRVHDRFRNMDEDDD